MSLEHGWLQAPVVDFDLFLLLFSIERKSREKDQRKDHLSDPQAECGGEGRLPHHPPEFSWAGPIIKLTQDRATGGKRKALLLKKVFLLKKVLQKWDLEVTSGPFIYHLIYLKIILFII